MLTVFFYLPARVTRAVERVCASRRDCPDGISELRLRASGMSSLVIGGRNVSLGCPVTAEEITATVSALCKGSLYAYRDTILRGYIPIEGGIRVGLCGRARYEDGHTVGICDISSLVFRVGDAVCESAPALIRAYEEGIGRGMLIYSLPGVGKTTALRALARYLGCGKAAKRVCVIDERCEFDAEAFSGGSVDLLRGYSRAHGIELATRTLNPQILMVDEIGNREEAAAIASVLGGGVPLIATAHGATYEEVRRRESLVPLFDGGCFSVCAGITRQEEVYTCNITRTEECLCVS